MTPKKITKNPTERLYEEGIASSSPALDILKPFGLNILGRILKGLGIAIDRGIDAIGLGRLSDYFQEPAPQPASAYTAPNIAGYRMAMARNAPISPSVYRFRMIARQNALKSSYLDEMGPGYSEKNCKILHFPSEYMMGRNEYLANIPEVLTA